MRLAIVAVSALFCAGAAYAQDDPCRNSPSDKARREFVEHFHAASAALSAGDSDTTLREATLAKVHATSGQQLSALVQLQVAAIGQRNDGEMLAAAMDAALATPCLPEPVLRAYRMRLGELRSGTATQQQ